jgi:membrane protein YqaA with SNARE-associated domain
LFGLIQASGTNSFPVKLPGWVAGLLGSSGGWALLVIAFVDSSFGSFPVINDLLVIWLTLKNYLAHKGGEVALRKKASAEQIERIRGWYERNEFLTVAIPSVLPPPTPFKLFVLAAGVFQVRLRYFLAALVVGRGVRYFTWGFLTIRYGERTITFLRGNFLQVSGVVIGVMLAGFLIYRLVERYRARRRPALS